MKHVSQRKKPYFHRQSHVETWTTKNRRDFGLKDSDEIGQEEEVALQHVLGREVEEEVEEKQEMGEEEVEEKQEMVEEKREQKGGKLMKLELVEGKRREMKLVQMWRKRTLHMEVVAWVETRRRVESALKQLQVGL